MMVDFILLGLLAAIIIMAAIIVARKFPVLAQLDVSSIAEARHMETKRDIIEARLYRKLSAGGSRLKSIISPAWQFLKEKFNKLYGKIARLERHYRLKARSMNRGDKNQVKAAVESLLEEARIFSEQEQYPDAERKLIEAISLDNHNLEVYKRLGKLYAIQGDNEHAIQSWEFALKLQPEDTGIYLDLSDIYQKKNDSQKVINVLQKAIEREPNNPKILDSLVGCAIDRGDKLLAAENMRKLKEVNPENSKIAEYQEKIDQMKL